MRLTDDKIEEVRAAADIVEVVGEHVRLKRQGGQRYVGLCPFHKEKSPSFSVDAVGKFYHCFGCGKGGDVFSFVRETEGVGFVDAVRGLAERYGVPLPQDTPEEGDRATVQETALAALRYAGRFFFHALTRSAEGRRGLDYLRGRGLTDETIKAYGLGYAPDRWDALVQAAENEGFDAEALDAAGLVVRRKEGDGVYDRYRGRVVFPIFSHTGRVVGFGGRQLTEDKTQPKYINSPETVVYAKSRVLYGLYQGRQEIRRTEEAILVEGYTDVLALHQAGITNAVATCGTALTGDQVALVNRFAKRIVLLYDADNAGLTAALKGVETVAAHWRLDAAEEKATRAGGSAEMMKRGLVVYVVALPPGDDPDSFVRREGADAMREYLVRHRKDFVAFAYDAARRLGRLATPEGTAEVQNEVLRAIAQLPSALLQQTYLKRAAEVMDVPTPALAEHLDGLRRTARRNADRPPATFAGAAPDDPDDEEDAPAPPPRMLPEEETLLRLMLEGGDPLVEFVLSHAALDEFTEGPPRALATVLLAEYEAGAVDPRNVLGGAHGPALQGFAAGLLAGRTALSDGWREHNVQTGPPDPREEATGALVLLKLDRVDDAITVARGALADALTSGDDPAPAQGRLAALLALRRHIEARGFLQPGAADAA